MQSVIYVGVLHQPKWERLFQVSVGFRVWHESRQLKVRRAVQALSVHEVNGVALSAGVELIGMVATEQNFKAVTVGIGF